MERVRDVTCQVCEEIFELEEEIEKGGIIYCANCYAELRVARLNPPLVEEVVDKSEDYDDYDDEEEE